MFLDVSGDGFGVCFPLVPKPWAFVFCSAAVWVVSYADSPSWIGTSSDGAFNLAFYLGFVHYASINGSTLWGFIFLGVHDVLFFAKSKIRINALVLRCAVLLISVRVSVVSVVGWRLAWWCLDPPYI